MATIQPTYAKLQSVLDRLPEVRGYVWDTSSYKPVAKWEASVIAAVKQACGKNSQQYKAIASALADESWKNTNRPDAVPPEVFVNRDFQSRLDNLEEMLKRYLRSLLAERKQTGRRKEPKTRRIMTAAERSEKIVSKKILMQLREMQGVLQDLRRRQMRLERRLLGLRRASKRGTRGVYDAKPRKLKR